MPWTHWVSAVRQRLGYSVRSINRDVLHLSSSFVYLVQGYVCIYLHMYVHVYIHPWTGLVDPSFSAMPEAGMLCTTSLVPSSDRAPKLVSPAEQFHPGQQGRLLRQDCNTAEVTQEEYYWLILTFVSNSLDHLWVKNSLSDYFWNLYWTWLTLSRKWFCVSSAKIGLLWSVLFISSVFKQLFLWSLCSVTPFMSGPQ